MSDALSRHDKCPHPVIERVWFWAMIVAFVVAVAVVSVGMPLPFEIAAIVFAFAASQQWHYADVDYYIWHAKVASDIAQSVIDSTTSRRPKEVTE